MFDIRDGFDAEEFIDGWSESFEWREELAAGKLTVADMLTNLKQLEEEYYKNGLREKEMTHDEWAEVEEELDRHTS